ncbi:NADP-dependent succinic semialdehyde dehydrogenase, partial [filamentous cyanobacterium CCP4]
MPISSINPATGEVLKTFEPLSEANLEGKLALAAKTFLTYRQTSFSQRAIWLRQAAQVLDDNKAAYAKIMTLEMGKPLAGAVAEVEKSALVCRYYADHGAEFLADEPATTDASRSFVRYQPLGPV